MDELPTGALPPDLEKAFQLQLEKRAQQEQRLLSRQMERRTRVSSGPAMKDYAEHVGYVILQAAEVDLRMAGLAALLHSGPLGYPAELLGLSGARLTESLRAAFPSTQAELDPLIRRYEAAYARRNQIVHAVRPDGERDGDAETFERTVRSLPGRKGWVPELNSAQISIESITVDELIEFEFELQILNTAASEWFQWFKSAGYGPDISTVRDSGG